MNALDYTTRITSRLPFWFAMRKKPGHNVGQAFLRAMGMELDEIAFLLDYLYDQLHIDKADLDLMDVCYKTMIRDIDPSLIDVVTGDGKRLLRLEALNDFINSKANIHRHEELRDVDAYYVDIPRKILYSRKTYNALVVTTTEGEESTYPLNLHSVWNYFDEFGLLLGVTRLPEEGNLRFKERIKDVFYNYSGSDFHGLMNGLARDLGCRTSLLLDDCSKDVEFQEDMVFLDSITDGGQNVATDRLLTNAMKKVVLKGRPLNEAEEDPEGMTEGGPTTVTYIHSIELHRMQDYNSPEDLALLSDFFYTDGTATPKLKKYADLINVLCPIMWNHARWDECHWIDSDFQFGYIPHITDASIQGFKLS